MLIDITDFDDTKVATTRDACSKTAYHQEIYRRVDANVTSIEERQQVVPTSQKRLLAVYALLAYFGRQSKERLLKYSHAGHAFDKSPPRVF